MTRILAVFTGLLAYMPISAAAQDDLQPFLQEELATIREANDLPAIGGAVMVGGNLVALDTQGNRRAGKDEPVSDDALWHIGSITKSFTASLAATLVEEGELSWDATLEEMLPDLSPEMDPQWRGATLTQLLTHTSGAPANFSIFIQFNRPDTPERLVAERRKAVANVLGAPPVTPPGEAYQYSNIGLTIAGHIIETKLGMSWEEAMRERLLDPLGLSSAGFGAPTGDNPWGHGSGLFGGRSARNPKKPESDNSPVMGPAGIMHLSLSDLATWGQHHLAGELSEEDGFLMPGTYKTLHTPKLDDYAIGWVVWTRDWAGDGAGPNVFWHNGSNTMWYALLVFLPEKDAVVALVTNDGTSSEAKTAFMDLTRKIATSLPQTTATGEE